MISISNKFLGCHDSIVEPTSLCRFLLNFHHQKVLKLSTMASLKQDDLLEMEMIIGNDQYYYMEIFIFFEWNIPITTTASSLHSIPNNKILLFHQQHNDHDHDHDHNQNQDENQQQKKKRLQRQEQLQKQERLQEQEKLQRQDKLQKQEQLQKQDKLQRQEQLQKQE